MIILASASYLMMLLTRLMTVSALFTTKPSYPGSRYTLSICTSSPHSGTLDQFRYVPSALTLLWCLKLVKVMHPPARLRSVWWLWYPFRYSFVVSFVSLSMTISGRYSPMNQCRYLCFFSELKPCIFHIRTVSGTLVTLMLPLCTCLCCTSCTGVCWLWEMFYYLLSCWGCVYPPSCLWCVGGVLGVCLPPGGDVNNWCTL